MDPWLSTCRERSTTFSTTNRRDAAEGTLIVMSIVEPDTVGRLRRSAAVLPPQLLALARTQHLAVTGAQAATHLERHGVRRAIREGALIRLWRGAYAVPEWLVGSVRAGGAAAGPISTPPHAGSGEGAPVPGAPVLTRLAAAELTLGGTIVACLSTAAELYGFGTERDHVTHVIGFNPSRLTSLKVHRTPTTAPLQRTGRFRVVHPAETAVRLAASAADPPRTLAMLDAALHSAFVSQAALAEMAAKLHIDGIRTVRRLVPLADPRAESPPESWLRWMCHDAGLPVPEPQFWVRCADGARYRLDLAWPLSRLALEYDGVEFHTGAALTRDRARLNALTAQGWTILAVTAPMLASGRPRLLAQITGELRRTGAIPG